MKRELGWSILVLGVLSWSVGAGAQDAVGTEAEAEASDQATAPVADDGAVEDEGAAAPSSQTAMDKGTYTVRLRDLEDRINRLKEQIFRSRARLSLLAETVLDRRIAGSKATISFRNEMGNSFKLKRATFMLDGAPIFNKSDEGGDLSDRESVDLFDGPVMPGDHTLSVVLLYQGHGYGIFSYLKGYSFRVRSSRTFTVGEGKELRMQVVGYEKGGVTTALEERPAVRYIENIADYEGKAAAAEAGISGGVGE